MGREFGLPNQKRIAPILVAMDDAAAEGDRPACDGRPDIFADYDSAVGDHSEAFSLCDVCKVFRICKQGAKVFRPAWGVWHGKVYVDGQTRNIGNSSGFRSTGRPASVGDDVDVAI